MLNAQHDNHDTSTVTTLVGLATLYNIFTQGLSSQQSELWSELLGWLILPVYFKGRSNTKPQTAAPFSNVKPRTTTSSSLWLVASGIAVCSFYKAEFGVVKFWPLLTPLLLAFQKYLGSESTYTRTTDSAWLSSFVRSVRGTTLPAVLITFTLCNGNFLWSLMSAPAVVAMLLVYSALLPRHPGSSPYLPVISKIEDDISPLSRRVAILLASGLMTQTYVFGLTRGTILSTMLLTAFKVESMLYTIQACQHVSWVVASVIGTFSLTCSRTPSLQSSSSQTLAYVIASIFTLWQLINMLPKRAKARYILWAFLVVPVVPYLANMFGVWSAQSTSYNSFNHDIRHPVDILVDKAVVDFEHLLDHQSKSFEAAQDEYRRRYNKEPPDGFKAWYEFAVSHNSPIIDDFDTIYDSVSPFWSLSGGEVLERVNSMQSAIDGEVWQCSFSSTFSKTYCSHPRRTYDRHISYLFNKVLGNFRPSLPDLKFLVNHIDEPRVVLSPSSKKQVDKNGQAFNLTNLSHQYTWDAITKYCTAKPDAKNPGVQQEIDTLGLPFVASIRSATDLCRNPDHSHMHGLFMSPVSFHLVDGSVPVLSTGAPSTMGDILYPSPAYLESEFQYSDIHDIDWHDKRNNLYWAGSTSGGYIVDNRWRWYQRQRFVELAQNLVSRQHGYLRERQGMVERFESSFFNTRLYDVAFTRIYQCETRYCRDQFAYFNMQSWADKDKALKSRLVFDMDGNGISGRYYKLLASKSVPLKQTLFREWHDDRLLPWVHFVPVSQSMEELPELVTYLTSNRKGQQKAKEIAERGRHWYRKALREVDLGIYLYRLLLELARLQDPERPAS